MSGAAGTESRKINSNIPLRDGQRERERERERERITS